MSICQMFENKKHQKLLQGLLGLFVVVIFALFSTISTTEVLGNSGPSSGGGSGGGPTPVCPGYGYGYGQDCTLYVPSEDYPTIQSAIDAAQAGQRILVAGGEYQENLDFAGKEKVKLIALESGAIINGRGNTVIENACNNLIDGFNIINAGLNHDLVVVAENCNNDQSVIANNIINGRNQARTGIAARGKTQILNNTIVNVKCEGCQQGGYAVAVASGRPSIINNILAGNKYGLACKNPDTVISHNDFWQNSQGNAYGSCQINSQDNFMDVNPRFVDEANDDYHIRFGSQIIDRGENNVSRMPKEDYDRESRVMDVYGWGDRIDIGADEVMAIATNGLINEDTVWSKQYNPYLIDGNILIAEGVTLTIEPGVEIRFSGDYEITVAGELIAKGLPEEKIVFTSGREYKQPGDWQGIYFLGSSVDARFTLPPSPPMPTPPSVPIPPVQPVPVEEEPISNASYDEEYEYVGGSIVAHALIEYSSIAIGAEYASPYIAGNEIRNSADYNAIIYLYQSNAKIDRNNIHDNNGRAIYYIGDWQGTGRINSNTIENNSSSSYSYGAGIYLSANFIEVENNLIKNNTTSLGSGGYYGNGGGMYINYSYGSEITGNKIIGNRAYRGGGLYIYNPSSIVIENNVLSNNEASNGGAIFVSSAYFDDYYNPSIRNNIIKDNTCSDYACGSAITIEYSSDLSVVDNNIVGNNGWGAIKISEIYWSDSNFEIHRNNLVNPDSEYEVYLYYYYTEPLLIVDAENNYWGTRFSEVVEERIWDHTDDSHNFGAVDYLPFNPMPANKPPTRPANPQPANGAQNQGEGSEDLRIPLSWQASDPDAGAGLTFDVYFSLNRNLVENLNNSVKVASNLNQAAYLTESLSVNQWYYWRIVARDNLGAETVGPIWSFQTRPLDAPALISYQPDPTNNQRPNLMWQTEIGAVKYHLQISQTSDFGITPKLVDDDNLTAAAYTPSFDLPTGMIYWRVSAKDSLGDESAFSEVDSFMIDIIPPAITIFEPDGSNDLADEFYTIKWNDEDIESNAMIALYYDTDNTGQDGTLIVDNLSEDDELDEYVWNVSSLPAGFYYVYAVINDHANQPATAYSYGPALLMPFTLYEDAEDQITFGWVVYDNAPPGAIISNVYDGEKQSRVIEFQGAGWDNAYRLYKEDFTPWDNTTQFTAQWSMKYGERFTIYIEVETTGGTKYLDYSPVNENYLTSEGPQYVHHGLGVEAKNNTWQTFARDLTADLHDGYSDLDIISVKGFFIRGNGRVDDIRLLEGLIEN